MSGVSEFTSKSALPLRNSSARTIASGTTRNRTLAIRGASWKYSGLRSRTTSSSCDCCRKRKGPVEIHLIVALQQAAEEESVDLLRLRIGGKARVEVGGAGFNEEGKARKNLFELGLNRKRDRTKQ